LLTRGDLTPGGKKANPGSFQPPFPFFRIPATGLFRLFFRGFFRKTLLFARIARTGVFSGRKTGLNRAGFFGGSVRGMIEGLWEVWVQEMRQGVPEGSGGHSFCEQGVSSPPLVKKANPGSFQPPFPFFRIPPTGLFRLFLREVFRKTLILARIA
jgi:hypothetical protein